MPLLMLPKNNQFADASLDDLSPDGKFSMAYNAARVFATIAIRAEGYRVKASGGGHYNTFLAMEAVMGNEYASIAAYFDACRKKRNELSYDVSDIVSDTEVEELLGKVRKFRDEVKAWLSIHHKKLS